jgi:hypothetical protein
MLQEKATSDVDDTKRSVFSIPIDNLRKYVPHKSIHHVSYKDLFKKKMVVLTWHLVHNYILYKYKFVIHATWDQHWPTNLWIRQHYTKKAQTTAQSIEFSRVLKICIIMSIEHQFQNIPLIHQYDLSNLIRIVRCTIRGIHSNHHS